MKARAVSSFEMIFVESDANCGLSVSVEKISGRFGRSTNGKHYVTASKGPSSLFPKAKAH